MCHDENLRHGFARPFEYFTYSALVSICVQSTNYCYVCCPRTIFSSTTPPRKPTRGWRRQS